MYHLAHTLNDAPLFPGKYFNHFLILMKENLIKIFADLEQNILSSLKELVQILDLLGPVR